jgi:hypothetical protein
MEGSPFPQVTFRVTARWQNPKTAVNRRKNLKKAGGPQTVDFGNVVEHHAIFRGFAEVTSRTPTLSAHQNFSNLLGF